MNKDFASHAAYCVLSPDKIETILDASKTLLEDTGVSVHDKQARSLMLESGAISGGGDTVKIPRELVAKALQPGPRSRLSAGHAKRLLCQLLQSSDVP